MGGRGLRSASDAGLTPQLAPVHRLPGKESPMTTVLQRGRATLVALAATLVFTTAALAQMPPSPWTKGAPFPEPDEELYGVAVNGKLYVIGGWGEGKARGANYEYDPGA